MTAQTTEITALYERLSRDDESQGESSSIINQKAFFEDYAKRNNFTNILHFTAHAPNGESRRNYRTAQSHRPNEVGRLDEYG